MRWFRAVMGPRLFDTLVPGGGGGARGGVVEGGEGWCGGGVMDSLLFAELLALLFRGPPAIYLGHLFIQPTNIHIAITLNLPIYI